MSTNEVSRDAITCGPGAGRDSGSCAGSGGGSAEPRGRPPGGGAHRAEQSAQRPGAGRRHVQESQRPQDRVPPARAGGQHRVARVVRALHHDRSPDRRDAWAVFLIHRAWCRRHQRSSGQPDRPSRCGSRRQPAGLPHASDGVQRGHVGRDAGRSAAGRRRLHRRAATGARHRRSSGTRAQRRRHRRSAAPPASAAAAAPARRRGRERSGGSGDSAGRRRTWRGRAGERHGLGRSRMLEQIKKQLEQIKQRMQKP